MKEPVKTLAEHSHLKVKYILDRNDELTDELSDLLCERLALSHTHSEWVAATNAVMDSDLTVGEWLEENGHA